MPRLTGHDGTLLGRRLSFTFADGTSGVLDAQRGQPFDEVGAALA